MRNYKRKSGRANVSKDLIKHAAEEVISGKSIRKAAKDNKIDRTTLSRYVSKLKTDPGADIFKVYSNPRQVFSLEQEKNLKEYLIKVASIYYGLTPTDVRRLAYECAVKYGRKFPESWHTNKMAGKDWLTSFLKRNSELSIRKPEPTSLGRATSFNKTNVKLFYDKLGEILDRYKFPPSRIWNIDETGVPTVMKPGKIIAAKGKHNVGSVTSGERGTNVTIIGAASASGNTVPVMFIFPRKKFKPNFIINGPPECIGRGNGSGWVTDDEFYDFLEHFIQHVNPTQESPVLMLLDNHSSHLSIKTVELAKKNWVVMLSFPPHCTHKLQPLDVSVYGPFKRHLSSAHDAWLRSNPGKTISIYDIPQLVATALPLAMTPTNISNGYRRTGIYPYNSDIFSEEDFMPSFVTDRPEAEPQSDSQPTTETNAELRFPEPEIPPPAVEVEVATSTVSTTQGSSKDNENRDPNVKMTATSKDDLSFSPEFIRPFPKAGPRKQQKTRGKKRCCAILTDTPEKDQLAAEQSKRKSKCSKEIMKSKKQAVKKAILKSSSESDEETKLVKKIKNLQKRRKVQTRVTPSSDTEEEEYFCLVCVEAYSDSLPGEKWLQCTDCRKWAHIKCTSAAGALYLCMNCDSD